MVQIMDYERVTHMFGNVTHANVVDGETARREALGVGGSQPRAAASVTTWRCRPVGRTE